jgi:hypothetical protein
LKVAPFPEASELDSASSSLAGLAVVGVAPDAAVVPAEPAVVVALDAGLLEPPPQPAATRTLTIPAVKNRNLPRLPSFAVMAWDDTFGPGQ